MSGYEVKHEDMMGYNVVFDGWLTIRNFPTKKAAKQFIRKMEHEEFINVR